MKLYFALFCILLLSIFNTIATENDEWTSVATTLSHEYSSEPTSKSTNSEATQTEGISPKSTTTVTTAASTSTQTTTVVRPLTISTSRSTPRSTTTTIALTTTNRANNSIKMVNGLLIISYLFYYFN